jgi:hypothetical protein
MEQPAIASDKKQPDPPVPSDPTGWWNPRWRLAVIGSILFHLLLAGALLLAYFPKPHSDFQTPSSSAMADASEGDLPEDAAVAESVESGRSGPEAAAATSEPRLEKAQIASAVTAAIENSDRVSDQRKQDELRRNLARLEKLATPESIDDVSGQVRSAMSLPERAVAPAEAPIAGPFDFDTAQFHDVVREPRESGGWRYRSVLVDAAGRTLETELDAEQGASVYETMRMIKSSPMGEAVYRSLVMPLLDKMIPRSTQRPESFSEAERERIAPPSPSGSSP